MSSSTTRLLLLGTLLTAALVPTGIVAQDAIPPIERKLPPPGIVVPSEQLAALVAATKQLGEQLRAIESHELYADVAVFHKALSYAIENGEFYDLKELKLAKDLLTEGNRRLEILTKKQSPDWVNKPGPTVRGYRSQIDDSIQPYGVVVPAGLKQPAKGEPPLPIYIWLHGRGDKQTDLQFVAQRLTKAGEFAPTNGLVVHPFGRHCNAFKFAGETDVVEAALKSWEHYAQVLHTPESHELPRFVLAGFSMGGAGAWHLGAHGIFDWSAISPGAGFAETARYQNITPDKLPSWYEQKLWGLYDAPGYVRNLFNLPVIAYSGEQDKQIQAARVMEEAYAQLGEKLDHRIGPGMGHKYHPHVLKKLTQDLERHSQSRQPVSRARWVFETRTLRYPCVDAAETWYPSETPFMEDRAHHLPHLAPLVIGGLKQHWEPGRVELIGKGQLALIHDAEDHFHYRGVKLATLDRIETHGVTAFALNTDLHTGEKVTLNIDGQSVSHVGREGALELFPGNIHIERINDRWQVVQQMSGLGRTVKGPFLQGPIDDAFYDPFLVVVPSGKSKHPAVERWVQFELAHFKDRWRRLFRGDVRIKKDTELTKEDYQRYHLIAWGDADSNALIKSVADKLPVQWSSDRLALGGKSYDPAGHVPVLIYPNPHPDASRTYIVINSGPTFREGHDSSNSLQTPKLPDWAIVDLSVLPDAKAPGRIVDAGFFDEQWRYQKTK